jgi:SAM-dependent MidA family methyltransferase
LVAAAAVNLLGAERAARCEFVEIGAEPGGGVLAGVAHGFRAARTIRLGEPIDVNGDVVVFSNELFDAQPFHRVVRRGASWVEMGIRLHGQTIQWTALPAMSPELAEARVVLPPDAAEGYVLDLPLAAAGLAKTLAAQPWRGLFLALDYGRTWSQLTSEYPAGTGRGYVAHRQADHLLAQPGDQDLTCHVCWDWLEAALSGSGFRPIVRESQEAFFVRRATAAIQRIVEGDPDPLSLQRTQLKQLLHPALMGQKFEALWALRE